MRLYGSKCRLPHPLFIVALSACLFAAAAPAADWFNAAVVRHAIAIDALGDAVVETRTPFREENAVAWHSALPGNTVKLYSDVTAAMDGSNGEMIVAAAAPGMAVMRRGRWQVELDQPYRLIYADGGTAVLVHNSFNDANELATVIMTIALPVGSRDIEYDRAARTLAYRLARKRSGNGDADVELTLYPRRQFDPARYKEYGRPDLSGGGLWVGRVVVRNTGVTDVTDVRIRYRLGESGPMSADSRYDAVAAGGTATDHYYPVLDAAGVKELRRGMEKVKAYVSYRTANGEVRETILEGGIEILDDSHDGRTVSDAP